MCQDTVEQLETEPDLLKIVVTGDESWIVEYDLLTKRQSLEWKSALLPKPKKTRVFKSKTKVMLIAFFDVHGIVHAEFLSQGQTINQHIYKNILRHLKRSVREKRRELWEMRLWLLHHDNAPAHNTLGIREFLAKNNIAVLEQPPYSPDQAYCDFFLFPKLKEVIKELVFKIQKPFKQSRRESSERSQRNPARSAWKHGRRDRKSAFEPKEITLKATCCKVYLSNKIKHL